MSRVSRSALSALALFVSACSGSGLDLTIAGTAEWDARSRGAATSSDRTVDVSFATNQEFSDAASKNFDSIEVSKLSVEVVSIESTNTATKASGRVEVGPADGSSRTTLGEYADLAVTTGSRVDVALTAEGRQVASTLLKSGTHAFKAYVTGTLDKAPAAVRLRATFHVTARVLGGGTKKDLGMVSLSISGQDSAATCSPNPCQNGGTCAAVGNDLVCACTSGFSGLQCEVADSCAAFVCQNGGTCAVGTNGAACTCAAGFTGTHCETPVVDPCTPNPCLNGGSCAAGAPSLCTCVGGFTGPTCEVPPQIDCYSCACTQLLSQGGCADICDMNLSGAPTPNFCNGTNALSQCEACIQSNCNSTSSACGGGGCTTGCSLSGACLPGTLPTACGSGGQACSVCAPNQQCIAGTCQNPVCKPDGLPCAVNMECCGGLCNPQGQCGASQPVDAGTDECNPCIVQIPPVPKSSACGSCVAAICVNDPFCCGATNGVWDEQCKFAVPSFCPGVTCP